MAALPLCTRGAGTLVSAGNREALQHEVTLLELVDRVLNKGVVLSGDITLAVADVDLVYVGLRVLLSSVATLEEQRAQIVAEGALR
jgi:gas vesicle structural protein